MPYIEMERANEEAASLINEYLGIQEEEGAKPFDGIDGFKEFMQSYFYEDISDVFDLHLRPAIRMFDPNSLLKDEPYFNVLKELNKIHKSLSLSSKTVNAFELYPHSSGIVHPEDFYRETPSFAYSPVSFSYPEFKKEGRAWMSLVPHELLTMESPIKEAKGSVLTYGLGMGYFAYKVSRKSEVSSLTVVESDKDVIDFFSSYLAPFFPMDKITLIQGDALAFAEQAKSKYDFLFSDINHDAEDGLPLYIKLRRSERVASINRYWIEEDILTYLRRYLIAFFEERCDEEIVKLGDRPYSCREDFASSLFASFYEIFKDKEFSSGEELNTFLSDDSLRNLVLKLNII